MMRGFSIALLLLGFSYSANAQTGYYGGRHSLEVKADLALSLKRRDNLLANGILKRPLRIVHPNIGFNYSFVPSRRLELSLGFEYSSFRESSIDGRYDDPASGIFDLLTAPKATIINGKFELKFYRKGSLSPIGKYLGFSIQFGSAFVKSGQTFAYGDISQNAQSGFFVRQYDVNSSFTATTDLTQKRIFNLTLQGKIGRVWPLTQSFSLVTGMSFPIGSAFLVPGQLFPVLSPFLILDGLGTYVIDESSNSDYDEMLMQSVRRVNALAMEVAFRFHF